jgi:hypothetical protein
MPTDPSTLILAPGDLGKTQWIRLADVFLVGPLMIVGGVALHRRSAWAGWTLGLLGVGTIALNGFNYLMLGQRYGAWR